MSSGPVDLRTRRGPRARVAFPPHYPEGDTCDWCWKFISPGFFWPRRKTKRIELVGKTVHFCDSDCLELWRNHDHKSREEVR